MSAFEHVTALLSFVYALALTHLLARIGELVLVRERVRFSGLLALGMLNAIAIVFANWLAIWDLRSVTSWDIASITIQFLLAISQYGLCVLVGPKASEEGVIDLEEFFWRQRRYIYGTAMIVLVLSVLANIDFLKTANTALFIKENIVTLILMVPALAALISRNRIVQWTAGLVFFVVVVVFTILFTGNLQ
ncbi:MAG TPA: hypothetical protein VEI58_10280 [Chthoniobacterales bacterium]|nr:hypothetical protein [Chthoniobacterales bacterium]